MRTAVAHTSVSAYYGAILGTGKEKQRGERIMEAVLSLGPCSRRRIAEHFRHLDRDDPLGQEAAVSSVVYALLKVRVNGHPVLLQDDNGYKDPATGQTVYLLRADDSAKQLTLRAI